MQEMSSLLHILWGEDVKLLMERAMDSYAGLDVITTDNQARTPDMLHSGRAVKNAANKIVAPRFVQKYKIGTRAKTKNSTRYIRAPRANYFLHNVTLLSGKLGHLRI